MPVESREDMIKFGCPSCGDIFKIANREQWVCNSCYSRFLPGMKKWKPHPTTKVPDKKPKRPRGRPRKENT
jgi:DNA-directed RNA polymerase subunit RPC12/RpoP